VPFLGHVIAQEGIAMDPGKVNDVLAWKPPNSMHQVRSILGLSSYQRRFIPNFSNISKLMIELLKKGTKYVWSKIVMKLFRH
jgi:hypothetical protein